MRKHRYRIQPNKIYKCLKRSLPACLRRCLPAGRMKLLTFELKWEVFNNVIEIEIYLKSFIPAKLLNICSTSNQWIIAFIFMDQSQRSCWINYKYNRYYSIILTIETSENIELFFCFLWWSFLLKCRSFFFFFWGTFISLPFWTVLGFFAAYLLASMF